ncbi:Retrovirus-related Pol polyprotein from transposon 17.6, partial [Mucuna pruriens]
MVIEGIVLGHLVSKKGIQVDKSKIDIITSLPKPTSVRDIRSFLGHAGFYRRFIKNFSKIALPLSKLLQKDVELNLTSPPDAKLRLIQWMLLLQEFNIEIKDKRGAENSIIDHLSKIEKEVDQMPITDEFPDEQLLHITTPTP